MLCVVVKGFNATETKNKFYVTGDIILMLCMHICLEWQKDLR